MANQDRQQQFGNNPGYAGGQQGGSASRGGVRQGGQGQQAQYQGALQQPGGSQQRSAPMPSGNAMPQGAGRRMTGGRGQEMSPYGGFGGSGGPFALMRRISDEMDRIFESFGMGSGMPRLSDEGGGGQGLRTLWSPHIEVSQREGKLLIEADLPGVRKEDVDVQVEPDAVILQGRRQQETTRDEQGFYHSERSYGSFYRAIPLPEGVDTEQANATFRDGVLCIELPAPQQRQRGRRLEIGDGGSSARSIEGTASTSSGASGNSKGVQGSAQAHGTGSAAAGGGA